MALLDAYATIADYRARTGDQGTGADAVGTAQLLAITRELERAMSVPPGAFNTHAGVYVFDGTGGTVLRLRDRDGAGYFLQSVGAGGIGIDSEHDATYDGYALDFDDAWVRGLPENAVAGSAPFDAIEILPHMLGAAPVLWEETPALVQITGTFGWAAVPEMLLELVCHRTNELRESLKAGGLGAVGAFDGEESMRPSTAWLWREVERLYGRKLRAIY